MQVVALNGGPRRGKISKSTMLLDAFIAGCKEAGANVELINLREKDIKQCTGCYSCWIKTQGECALKDDMREILSTLKQADLEIWSTPLYFFGPTGLFKNFLDRNVALMEPYIIDKDGLCSHPMRTGRMRNVVFMSVAGFYELEHFQPMSNWLHYMANRGLINIKAEIYRTSAEFMSAPPLKEKVDNILAATMQAGREIIIDGALNPETLETIQANLISEQSTFIELANKYWDWEIKRKKANYPPTEPPVKTGFLDEE